MVSKKHLFAALLLITSGIIPIAAAAQDPAASPDPASISLDGDWHFLADPQGSLKLQGLATAADIRPTRVPSSWQLQFDDLRDYAGAAWYWRSFDGPALAPGQIALLRFGAVDYRAEVFVNGQRAGTHDGGYLPFEFDVTSLLGSGKNEVAVRVTDPGPKRPVEGINYAEIPHGKQSWYLETSGIWQSVELEIKPRIHFGVVHITAGMSGGFTVQARVANPPAGGNAPAASTVRAQIVAPGGAIAWQGTEQLGPDPTMASFSGTLPHPDLWSPDHPALYTLRLQLSSGDRASSAFGFRTFETRNGKFYLNGKAVYLRGALDQDFYPDTGYTPPSLEYVKEEMKKAKGIGLNLLRCHIKVPDPRYLEAADEVGLLVWYEIPNWDKLTADSQSRALETLRGMAERDWNHPSIVQVSIINESWGANLKEPADRAWLMDVYQQAKKIVPWLVDDNSPCCDNFHLATDIADFHTYDAIPDHAADFDRFVSDLATRPGWLFSPYGDAAPKGDEPLVLSEFGNWGLPAVPENKPWWFSREFGGREITLPEGVEERFREYGYNSIFPDLRSLTDATEWHEFQALRYEIGSLRMHPEIQGYVITEFNDTHWESNGMDDMWRNPKVFAKRLSAIQQDDLLVLRADERNFHPGSKAEAAVYFSHYSSRRIAGAAVRWQITGTSIAGSFPLPPVPEGSAVRVGTIAFTVPATSVPAREALQAEAVLNGEPRTGNSLDFFFYPDEKPELPPPVSFHDPQGGLRRLVSEMRARGYQEPSGQEAFPVLISSTFDGTVKEALESGGRAILLATGAEAIGPGMEIVPRRGDLGGNWISDFPWIRRDRAPFKGIGFGPLEGFEAQAITPPAVIRGIPPKDFSDVLSGVFYGWIHDNAGTLVEARYGKGRLLICTYSLAASYGTDPYATALLDSLINYAVSDFNPQWEIPH